MGWIRCALAGEQELGANSIHGELVLMCEGGEVPTTIIGAAISIQREDGKTSE